MISFIHSPSYEPNSLIMKQNGDATSISENPDLIQPSAVYDFEALTTHPETNTPPSDWMFLDKVELPESTRIKGTKVNEYVKTYLFTGALSSFDLSFTPAIVNIVTNKLGFCLGNFIPAKGVSYLASYVVNPLARLNNRIGSLFGSNITSNIFISALCEEIEFRWFVQGILLKKLPQKVIEKIAPDLAYMVDSMPAKISRVAASALFFALCHTYALNCAEGGGIAQLIGGLLYGTLYETSDQALIHCINLHCLYNLILKSY